MYIACIVGAVTTGLSFMRWCCAGSDFIRNLIVLGSVLSCLFGMSSFAYWWNNCYNGDSGIEDYAKMVDKEASMGPGAALGLLGWITFLFVVVPCTFLATVDPGRAPSKNPATVK
jgi:hypothetical protein